MVSRYMDNIKNDKYYASIALENIEAIQKYIKDVSYEQYIGDGELIDATMFRLVQLIENINHISFEAKSNYSNIPWGKISGFRNGIVHEYGETDYVIVYETITQDLGELKEALLSISLESKQE